MYNMFQNLYGEIQFIFSNIINSKLYPKEMYQVVKLFDNYFKCSASSLVLYY